MKTQFDLPARLKKARANIASLNLNLAQCSEKYQAWAKLRNNSVDISDMSEHDLWLHERSLGLGGSDIGALLGVSHFTTRFQLWLDKAKQVVTFTGNNFSKWGNLLENTIGQNFADMNGLTIELSPPAFAPKVMQWLPANIDFDIPGTDFMGEIKTASAETKMNWGEGLPEDIEFTESYLDEFAIDDINDCIFPEAYFCQMQDYMMLKGKKYCFLVALIGGNDERVYVIKANPAFQELIRLEATYFMMHNVIDNNPPLMTEFELLEQHVACDFSDQVEATEEIEEKITQLTEVKENIKALDKTKKELEKDIKLFIGDKEELVNSEHDPIAVWGGYDKTTLDRELLEDLYPEIFDEVKQVKQVRTLRIK